ncbi:MAG: helix-turn-helix transcriptional regulator [Polyangiaceae bacterium]
MTTADYVAEKRHATLTPGQSLQIARELQELTQSELSRMTGIAQSAISAFESGAAEMGLKRVKVLAEALKVHPAVIAFPEYPQAKSAKVLRAAAEVRHMYPVARPAARAAKKAAVKVAKRPAKKRTG